MKRRTMAIICLSPSLTKTDTNLKWGIPCKNTIEKWRKQRPLPFSSPERTFLPSLSKQVVQVNGRFWLLVLYVTSRHWSFTHKSWFLLTHDTYASSHFMSFNSNMPAGKMSTFDKCSSCNVILRKFCIIYQHANVKIESNVFIWQCNFFAVVISWFLAKQAISR